LKLFKECYENKTNKILTVFVQYFPNCSYHTYLRWYIYSTGPTILGYLTDGVEVAVKILDSSVRRLSSVEMDRLKTIDVSKYFIIDYKVYTIDIPFKL